MAKKKKKQQGRPSSPKQQRVDLVQEAFRYSARLVNQRNYDNPQLKASLDFDQIRIKRRTSAVLATIEEVRERVLNQYPELRDGFSVESDWAEVNAQPRPAYDGEEEMSTVSLGAAIWMLDKLKDCGRLHQATPLFPMDDGQLDDIDMPDVWDPCHSEEIITFLIRFKSNCFLILQRMGSGRRSAAHLFFAGISMRLSGWNDYIPAMVACH